MKLAAIQFKPTRGDWTASAARLESLIAQAAGLGSSLIVCPEMALTGYLFESADAARAVAEPASGPTHALLSALAARHGVYLIAGFPESAEEGLFNSALLLAPDGSLLACYRKRLLFDADQLWAQSGDTPYPLIETPLGVLTCGICMDLNDSRFIRFLRATQPDIIAFPTNWLDQGHEIASYWRHRLRGVRSVLVAANNYGTEPIFDFEVPFRGESAILDQDGRVVVSAPRTGDLVISAAVEYYGTKVP